MATRPNADTKDTAGTDDLARQIAELRGDLEKLAATLGDAAQGKAAGLIDQLQKRIATIGGETEARIRDRVAGAGAAMDEVTDYARRKPLNALAVAAGLGMVLGILFGRR